MSNFFSAVLYYIFLLPVSKLPFSVLYTFSDILFWVLFKGIRYRKSVVETNLRNSFPQYSPQQINQIVKAFYQHLCDIIVETIKGFSITENEIRERIVSSNPELVNHYFEKNQSVILFGGHYNNWEWYAMGVPFMVKHQTVALYSDLTNPFFNLKMKASRSQFGTQMVSKDKIKDFFIKHHSERTATIFAFDQSPFHENRCYWTNFLNQETGFMYGVELFAKRYNLPVIYGTIHKTKRGYYSVEYKLISDNPKELSGNEIMEIGIRLLEKDIMEKPQYWLWSHRRWKIQRRR